MKSKSTFTLTHDSTGESVKAVVVSRSMGIKFVKFWKDTGYPGWRERIDKLQGNSLKVFFHLMRTVDWGNAVISVGEVSRDIVMAQPHVSRAYKELLDVDILRKINGKYIINPFFCWYGDDIGYEQMVKEFMKPIPSEDTDYSAVLVLSSSPT
jgi:hypothetical protein